MVPPMRLIWILVLVANACGSPSTAPSSPSASGSPGATTSSSTALPAEWLACTTDEDCQAVEMGCCDHCNGGWVLGVNNASVEAARAKYRTGCTDMACTELGCGGVKGACREGACTWAWDVKMDGNYVPQPNTVERS
jgi:hypothetical protein